MKKNLGWILLFAAFAALILFFPQRALYASRQGFDLWIKAVFPALFPFFVISTLLKEYGAVDLLSRGVGRAMPALFGCPPQSAYVLFTGLLCGYPAGARAVSELAQEGYLDEASVQRCLIFCNTSGPLFMVGTVGTTLLGSPELGWIIALGHYLSALICGFLTKFLIRGEKKERAPIVSMQKAAPPFGSALKKAVLGAMEAQLLVGGLIVLFNALWALLQEISIAGTLAQGIHIVLPFIPENLTSALGAGIMELTVGCNQVVSSAAPTVIKIALCSALVSWGGLCIQAQSMAMLGEVKIRVGTYWLFKLLHALLAFALVLGFYQLFPGTAPAFAPAAQASFAPGGLWLITLGFFIVSLGILIGLNQPDRRSAHRGRS